MALPEYKSQKTKVWQYLNQPLSVLKSALGITNGGGGGDFLTTTVTITAAELLTTAAGNTLKELIPAPGAGKYIAINQFVGKFKNATVAYDNSPFIEFLTNVGLFGT